MSFEEHSFVEAGDRSPTEVIATRTGITNEIKLKSGKLLEICRTTLNHLAGRVGQVVPRLPTHTLSAMQRECVESSIQRFPQGRRVSLGAELVDKLENTSNIVVDLEDLHRQRGLKVRKRGLLRRLGVPHRGFDIRQAGLDVLETHGGGVVGNKVVPA
jgi:hypothetical protein